MLSEIKKNLILDIEVEIESIKEVLDDYHMQVVQNGIVIDTKVGIFDRLFKTKKYKKKKENDSFFQNKNMELIEYINNKKMKLRELSTKRDTLKRIKNFDDLPFKSRDELYNYCVKKNVQISSDDYIKYFREQISKDYNLMLLLVEDNLSNLKYDRSNNIELYKYFLNKKIGEYEQYKNIFPTDLKTKFESFELDMLKKLLSALNNHTYNIEFENYLMEWIRRKCDFFVDFKNANELCGDDKYKWYSYMETIDVDKCFDLDYVYKQYQSSFGQELQKLYENDKLLIGVHGTDYVTNDIKDNKIFSKGLKNSTQTGAIRCMDRTVAYDLPFIDLLDYGSLSPICNYYIAIPKDVYYSGGPIWGSDMVNSDDNFLLPEYIYGMLDRRDKNEFKFIKNNLPNKKEYSVFYADKSNEPIHIRKEEQSSKKR